MVARWDTHCLGRQRRDSTGLAGHLTTSTAQICPAITSKCRYATSPLGFVSIKYSSSFIVKGLRSTCTRGKRERTSSSWLSLAADMTMIGSVSGEIVRWRFVLIAIEEEPLHERVTEDMRIDLVPGDLQRGCQVVADGMVVLEQSDLHPDDFLSRGFYSLPGLTIVDRPVKVNAARLTAIALVVSS